MENSISRRSLMAGAATAAATLATTTTANAKSHTAKTYVLVHGSWHGGWCWRDVRAGLRADGHDVYTPTLTGLAERAHLISGLVDLNTHIRDIASFIRYNDLQNIVLVGHSYAGLVVSGVAEEVGDKIDSIVFLDAFMLGDGETMNEGRSEKRRAGLEKLRAHGGISRPPIPPKAFGVPEDKLDWVASKLTPQPIGPNFTPVKYTGARDRIAKKMYIRTAYANPNFDRPYNVCKADSSWTTHMLTCGHDAMVAAPDELTTLLKDA